MRLEEITIGSKWWRRGSFTKRPAIATVLSIDGGVVNLRHKTRDTTVKVSVFTQYYMPVRGNVESMPSKQVNANPVPAIGSRWVNHTSSNAQKIVIVTHVDHDAKRYPTAAPEIRIFGHYEEANASGSQRPFRAWYSNFKAPAGFFPAPPRQEPIEFTATSAKPTTIAEWYAAAYGRALDKGFHDDDADMSERERVSVAVNNLHSEVSELWEAYRAGNLHKPCDKAERMAAMGLRPLTCIEEEMADIALRNSDNARALGVDLQEAMTIKHAYNGQRAARHGGKLA